MDNLAGFFGDMQAQWFEAGFQKGGEYRCGAGCGCPASLFPSYASNIGQTIPSYEELQKQARGGVYGKKVGYNLHNLSAVEMRAELHRQGLLDPESMDRDKYHRQLCATLTRVQ